MSDITTLHAAILVHLSKQIEHVRAHAPITTITARMGVLLALRGQVEWLWAQKSPALGNRLPVGVEDQLRAIARELGLEEA